MDEKDNQPTPAPEEPTSAPAEPIPAPEEPTPAPEEPTPDIVQLFNDYKREKEAEIKELEQSFNTKLKEREELIKSLLGEPPKQERQSVAEKINATRNYKKW